jgi:hypothetical protein
LDRDQDMGYCPVHVPQNFYYSHPVPSHSAERDHEQEHRDVQGPQSIPYPYPGLKDPEHRDRDQDRRGIHSCAASPQDRASSQDAYGTNMLSRPSPLSRKPVPNT